MMRQREGERIGILDSEWPSLHFGQPVVLTMVVVGKHFACLLVVV